MSRNQDGDSSSTTRLPNIYASPGNVGVQIDSYRTKDMFHRPRSTKFTTAFHGHMFQDHTLKNAKRMLARELQRRRDEEERAKKLAEYQIQRLEAKVQLEEKRKHREYLRKQRAWEMQQAMKAASQLALEHRSVPPQRSFLQRWNEVPSPVAKSLESFIQDPNLAGKLKISFPTPPLSDADPPVLWRSRDAAELCAAMDAALHLTTAMDDMISLEDTVPECLDQGLPFVVPVLPITIMEKPPSRPEVPDPVRVIEPRAISQWLSTPTSSHDGEWTVLLDEDFDAKADLINMPLAPPPDQDDDDHRIERCENISVLSSGGMEHADFDDSLATLEPILAGHRRPKSILKKSTKANPTAPVLAVGSSQFSLRKDSKRAHWVIDDACDDTLLGAPSIPSIKKTIQICLSDLIKVDVALKCNHATHDSFHSLGTVAYTCVKCGVRVDSTSKSYLFVQALDTAKFEYLLVTLRPKLLLHLERQNMALEDVQSFCRHHRVELETTAALLLQRAILLFLRRKHGRRAESRVLVSLNAHDRRRRQRQCARDLYRVQCRVRRKPIKLLQIVDGALSLGRSYDANDNVDLPAKISTPTPTTLRESIAASTPESVGRLPSNQATPSTAPLLPYSNLQTSTASLPATEVISSIVLPSIERSTPSPEFYRCFAPQCGGRKFLNKKWYVLHMEKVRRRIDRRHSIFYRFMQHATTKKRLHDEAAFLDRMRNHGLPMLRQHTEAPPPVPQKPMSKQCLPSLGNHKSATMLMQLVRLDTVAAADAQVVRVTRDMAELVMGRSVKHCDIIIDCPAYPGLVSKQHLRLVISDSTCVVVNYLQQRLSRRTRRTVVVEDLGSKNGTFVNGKQQHQRLELYAGDMLELGRVKHRPESGVVFVCHLPNCTTSTL
ncbi:hypothetical protein DYB32_007458 [Aphanomyces invadans]|uniref:FHA domain-containing protein n=1 Tax=Aphanomyces invadans TaxID=157072 RepID=A0A418ANW3_9STRA|nr:hypothetical protein DYB32_007458 [Aphanomyces invadans]